MHKMYWKFGEIGALPTVTRPNITAGAAWSPWLKGKGMSTRGRCPHLAGQTHRYSIAWGPRGAWQWAIQSDGTCPLLSLQGDSMQICGGICQLSPHTLPGHHNWPRGYREKPLRTVTIGKKKNQTKKNVEFSFLYALCFISYKELGDETISGKPGFNLFLNNIF